MGANLRPKREKERVTGNENVSRFSRIPSSKVGRFASNEEASTP